MGVGKPAFDELESMEESDAGALLDHRNAFPKSHCGSIAVVTTLLLTGAAAMYTWGAWPVSSKLERTQSKVAVDTTPARDACSPERTNCIESKCCKISGHRCFHKDSTWAECKEHCPSASWACWEERPWWSKQQVVYWAGTSMYCFTVYIEAKVDSSHPSHERELLQAQAKYGVSLFACDDSEVFSDVDISLPAGRTSTKVLDVEGEFKKLIRWDKPWKYVNTPLYYQVWKAIHDHGRYQHKDYTVKVDPVTVFLPSRLAAFLAHQGQTERGDFFENCRNVDSGFFGNLEVMNSKAMTIFLEQLVDCKLSLCWQSTDDCKKDWKFGPWGEDVFMARCFERHGVAKRDGFQLTVSGSCPFNRPPDQKKNKSYVPPCPQQTPAVHPFKTPEAYFSCLGSMTGLRYN